MDKGEKISAVMSFLFSESPFEAFVDKIMSLKTEMDAAGEMNEDRQVIWEKYKEALFASRPDYEKAIAILIGENFSEEDLDALLAFYKTEAAALVRKAAKIYPTAVEIGGAWMAKVAETIPGMQHMFQQLWAKWQRNNSPPDWDVLEPGDNPETASEWKPVDDEPTPVVGPPAGIETPAEAPATPVEAPAEAPETPVEAPAAVSDTSEDTTSKIPKA